MTEGYKSTITAEEIEKLPKCAFGGKITVIDRIGPTYFAAIAHLRAQKVIGFDTETKPQFAASSYHNMVALLQLSSSTHAYLFRISEIGMHWALCKLLSNPNVIKVGAACGDDVHGLYQYRKFNARAFVDLQKMVGDFGITDVSVKKMAAIILGVKISKSQQLSNWEAFHLTDSQKLYAATDAWICREMYLKLTSDR